MRGFRIHSNFPAGGGGALDPRMRLPAVQLYLDYIPYEPPFYRDKCLQDFNFHNILSN